MQTLFADETLPAELGKVAGPVEIRSRDGRLLGVFTPAPEPDLEPRISDEEFRRRITDPNAKWHTAAEVEARMREWRCSK